MSSWSKYQPRWRADLTNNNIQYFLEWRDAMANSPRQADYAWMVLMRLVSWARARGLTTYRPPDRIERLYQADRSEKIWLDDHVAAFMDVASEPLQHALVVT